LIDTLQILWNLLIKDIWEAAYPKLIESLEEKKRLFETYALPEFLEKAFDQDKTVIMKIDEENQTLVCCKGQFRIPFQNLGIFYLMPSIFNSRRFWTFYQNGDYTTIFLPYFEGAIMLDGDEVQAAEPAVQTERPRPVVPVMDPALIFKALGDNTRYAIVSHIAQTPCTAAELSKLLKVSKPTISHHVQLLREAGLLREEPSARSVQLSVKREVIEHLSQATVGDLFTGVSASG
jgi:ArsR family transcriptional regulator